MRGLLFVARVAVICNIFFIVCLVLRAANLPLGEGIKAFIIVTGYPLSFFINLSIHIILISLFLSKKPVSLPLPVTIFNVACFIFQIFFFLLF